MATLNPNLKSFWLDDAGKFRPARNRVLYGGRSSSKSWEFAGRAAGIAQEFKSRFLCVRRYQSNIKDSVYTLIKNQIENFDFAGYEVQARTIDHINGSEFVFYGIERNIEEIKSFEGADVLWIEEAQNLTADQWAILEPTIRKEGSEIWLSFNGRLVSDFVWQTFVLNPPPDTIAHRINYLDNPFLSDTMIKIIDEMKAKNLEQYKHVYLGDPLSGEHDVIIKSAWVDAAIDFHLKTDLDLDGATIIGYDVADSGDDKNATTLSKGCIVIDCQEWQGNDNELKKSADRVRLLAIKENAFVIYDSIGVGAHTGSTLQSEGFANFAGFNAGGKVLKPSRKYHGVKQKDYFSNLKAQAWWMIADRFRQTYDYVENGNTMYQTEELISLSSRITNIDALISELITPKKDFDKTGRVKVESKSELLKRGIKSPNRADSFIMAQSIGLIMQNRVSDLTVTGF